MAGRDGAGQPGRQGPRAPAARRRRGGLSDEDRDLWTRVARKVAPMAAAERRHFAPVADQAAPPSPPAAAPKAPAAPVALPPGFRVGAASAAALAPGLRHDRAPTPAERLAADPLRMDHKTHQQLLRGKLRPESRLDLHGMTLAAAKPALTDFVLGAQAAGRRLVLVITGKGKGDHGPLPTRSGALRHEVPHWLRMAPLAGAVLQVVPAHLRHGGGGAYYVYLRRRR